ncbi:MAG: hypothetical protein D4R74_09450 [Betaproteobacteria bacterium]|nr:MAG: hypothetical protein D4R74_09450 [Betaproteobacteria bacterium]
MKRFPANLVVCLLGSALIAGCAGAGSRLPPVPAVLVESPQHCRAQLTDAVRELTGKFVTLAADAFTQNDSVVLSTAGQSASGRMMPPTQILRLELAAQGCLLRLGDQDRAVVLPQCSCRAVAGR